MDAPDADLEIEAIVGPAWNNRCSRLLIIIIYGAIIVCRVFLVEYQARCFTSFWDGCSDAYGSLTSDELTADLEEVERLVEELQTLCAVSVCFRVTLWTPLVADTLFGS